MKRFITLCLFGLVTTSALTAAANPKVSSHAVPKVSTADISYAIGYNLGKRFHAQGFDLDTKIINQSFVEGYSDTKKPRLNAKERQKIIIAFQLQQLRQRQTQVRQLMVENATAGKKFQASNKTKKGVKELANGLQYRVLSRGNPQGPSPSLDDTVIVQYQGRFINGKEFDSSATWGRPATFKLHNVIPGWSQALQNMRKGDKWEVVIPPELAYGQRGVGNLIGPNTTLVYELQLVDVQKNPLQKKASKAS